MAKFNLEKAVQNAKFVVEKRGVPNIKAQVIMNLDVSGSARQLFASGQMQEAFQRIVPLGLIFDDNGELDVFTFADSSSIYHVQPCATKENYNDYIKRNILENRSVPLWGGTDYAPVLEENLKVMGFYKKTGGGFFTKPKVELSRTSSSGFPSIVYFFTDGANNDKSATMRLLEQCQGVNTQMYVMFVGIGSADFSFIQKLGDKFDNTGFINIKDLASIDDDSIYEQLLPQELCTWLQAK